MKKSFQILTILLAMLVFLSPVLSFASVLKVEAHASEMSCCAMDDSDESHDCCHSDEPVEENKCGDNGCPTNDCHLHQASSFHVYFPVNPSEKEIGIISSEKLKSDNYSSFPVKDMSFSFWNPPKYIS